MIWLAIIFTAAIPISIGTAIVTSGAWSRAARSNSDMTLGVGAGMAFAAACAWTAWWLT